MSPLGGICYYSLAPKGVFYVGSFKFFPNLADNIFRGFFIRGLLDDNEYLVEHI
jgi:hypothetical protein